MWLLARRSLNIDKVKLTAGQHGYFTAVLYVQLYTYTMHKLTTGNRRLLARYRKHFIVDVKIRNGKFKFVHQPHLTAAEVKFNIAYLHSMQIRTKNQNINKFDVKLKKTVSKHRIKTATD
jgi:hypothetical protein